MKNEEPMPVGKTKEAQELNAKLLSGYEYEKYISALTGFAGQDRQRINLVSRRDAVRTRIGVRGHFKAGMAQLPDGRLVAAVSRKKQFNVPALIYESTDMGLTWQKIADGLMGEDESREMSLTALPDGSLVLTSDTAEGIEYGK